MKLTAFVLILALAAVHCVVLTAGAAAVGRFAPDRYEGIPEMCLKPMDMGYCRAKEKRFYFDMRRMKCAVFYWGGCGGNINNFKSMEECNKVCLESYEDVAADVRNSNSGERERDRAAVQPNSGNSYKSIRPTKGVVLSKNVGSSSSSSNSNNSTTNSNTNYKQYQFAKTKNLYAPSSSQSSQTAQSREVVQSQSAQPLPASNEDYDSDN